MEGFVVVVLQIRASPFLLGIGKLNIVFNQNDNAKYIPVIIV
jgi:hypothetical protein